MGVLLAKSKSLIRRINSEGCVTPGSDNKELFPIGEFADCYNQFL